jgi:hypothetical protein
MKAKVTKLLVISAISLGGSQGFGFDEPTTCSGAQYEAALYNRSLVELYKKGTPRPTLIGSFRCSGEEHEVICQENGYTFVYKVDPGPGGDVEVLTDKGKEWPKETGELLHEGKLLEKLECVSPL